VFLALFLDQLAGVALVFGIVNGEACKWITKKKMTLSSKYLQVCVFIM
jgi:hypothetical protein